MPTSEGCSGQHKNVVSRVCFISARPIHFQSWMRLSQGDYILSSPRLTLNAEVGHRCQFANRAHAKAVIFERIEVFYNRERLHSALGYQSPVDFETKLN